MAKVLKPVTPMHEVKVNAHTKLRIQVLQFESNTPIVSISKWVLYVTSKEKQEGLKLSDVYWRPCVDQPPITVPIGVLPFLIAGMKNVQEDWNDMEEFGIKYYE